jgi:uncharacterized protein (TIGR00266 family)
MDSIFGLTGPTIARQGKGQTGLDYQVLGTTVQTLILYLTPGQTVFTESGGIGWMSPNIRMDTNTRGGLGTGFKRILSGGSFFLVEYSCEAGRGVLAFTPSFPGRIMPLHLEDGQRMFVQKKRLLCAENTIEIGIGVQRKLETSFLGGVDFFMQKLTGPGVAFVCLDGDNIIYTLDEDQMLVVDPELIAMYDPSVDLDIEVITGVKNILFSGRKICQVTLQGPGRVFLQSLAVEKLARTMHAHQPKSTSSASGRVHTSSGSRRPSSGNRPSKPPKPEPDKKKPTDDVYHTWNE